MRNLVVIEVDLAEAEAAKAISEAKIKEFKAEMIEQLTASQTVGRFFVKKNMLKTWTYSKAVHRLERMLKTRKDTEQKEGIATFEQKESWAFVNTAK